jgi:hypothetical protein
MLTLIAHFMLAAQRSGNFNILSHLSISFLSGSLKQYGACGLLRFTFVFVLAS